MTAEFAQVHDEPETVLKHFIIELVVLTLIVALVVSLVLLRKRGVAIVAKRAA